MRLVWCTDAIQKHEVVKWLEEVLQTVVSEEVVTEVEVRKY